MTKLVMHYTPGVLVVLKREPCPTSLDKFRRAYPHGPNCCNGTHVKWRTVGRPVLVAEGERPLQLCWIPRVEKRQREAAPA